MRFRGYIALITVLTATAVGLTMTTSLLIWGLAATQTSSTLGHGIQARLFASACAEDALRQVHNNPLFTGAVNLAFPEGTCGYTVANTGGNTRLIQSTGKAATTTQRVSITLDRLAPSIRVASWREVASF